MDTPHAAAKILLSLKTSSEVTISVHLGKTVDPLRSEVQRALRDACFDKSIIDQAVNWRIEHGVIFCPFMSDEGVRMADFKKEVSAIGQALCGRSTRKRKQKFCDLDEDNLLRENKCRELDDDQRLRQNRNLDLDGEFRKREKDCDQAPPYPRSSNADPYAVFLSNDPADRMSVNLWLGAPAVSCWVGRVLSETKQGVFVEWYKGDEDVRFTTAAADCRSFYHGPTAKNSPLCVFRQFDRDGRIPQEAIRQAQQAATLTKL